MQKAEYWIDRLQLLPHPEGGFYRETYRSSASYSFTGNAPFEGSRFFATAIYYLLRNSECSKLHRIHSDELWFFHAGDPLKVHLFPERGEPSSFTLGTSADEGQVFQEFVPAGIWFGAALAHPEKESYALVSCVVAPGFDFRDFSFADRAALLQQFPGNKPLIERLT
ncbi:cupin domain-containing protein [Chlorobium sp. KB01]|uniref:cupin domain-containing protein n=1 Tax=Chlorobium sp. KB01 TaxID=1917528 RepID=UPI00097670D6|nr:cupin domain-containing protein [Chlorobium sp. KB01]